MRFMHQRSIAHEILRRSIWVTLGSVIGRALPLLASVLLSRQRGLENFAVVGLVLTWMAVIPSLTTWGIGLVATQTMASQGKDYYRAIVKRSVLSALIGMVIVHTLIWTLGKPWMSKIYPGLSIEKIGPTALAAGAFASFFVLIQAFLNGCHQPKKLSALLAMSGLVQGLALCSVLFARDTESGTVYLAIAAAFTTCFASVVILVDMKNSPPLQDIPDTNLRQWLRKVIPAILSSATVAPITFICASMIASTSGGARELGAFFALEQVGMLLTYVPSLISQSTVPVLSTLVRDDERKAIAYVLKMAKYQFLLLAAMFIAAVPTAPFLLGVYGQLSDFRPAYFLLLTYVLIFVPLGTIGSYLQAAGKFVTGSVLNIIWALVFLGSSTVLRPHGAAGIELARVVATCALGIGTVIVLYLSIRRLGHNAAVKVVV